MPGKGRLCEICKNTRASCGIPETYPTRCGKCKTDGMINLTISKCIVCKLTIPIYGVPGSKASHCKKCKTDDMIDIKTQKCKKCKKVQAVYGMLDSKKAEYCVNCKEDGMIDIRSYKCETCNIKQPFFGNIGDKKATRCKDCKEDNMIDLKSTKCIICKLKFPIFGLPGGKNTHCSDCKTDVHIDVKNNKCVVCNKKQSTYGDPIIKHITHCKECKPSSYIDLKHLKCISEHCNTRAHENYRGYCAWCFQHLFPEDQLSHKMQKKTYEVAVATELLAYDSLYKHDVPLFVGGCDCSIRRRIDFWKIIGNTILAVEVDENQHKRYDLKDEEIRYHDLYMGFSGKWVFLRFNPNVFRDSNGKIQRISLNDRIKHLLEMIKYHENRIKEDKNNDIIEIYQLYYDKMIK